MTTQKPDDSTLPDEEIIDVDPETEEQTPEDIALQGMLAELRGSTDAIVNVYSQTGRGKRLGFMFTCSPDEYTGGELMEKIRDEFGPGDYRIHIRSEGQLIANRPVSIAEPVKGEEKPRDESGNMVMQMMQRQMEMQQAMFTQSIQSLAEAIRGSQNQPPQMDPVTMQKGLLESMVAMRAMLEDKKPAKEPIEYLLEGVKLIQEVGGNKGDTNSTDVLLKGLEMFAPTIAAAAAGQIPAQITGPKKGTGDLAPPESNNADVKAEKMKLLQQAQLRANVAYLLGLAKGNKDPELYAEVILDQVGEENVLTFIGREDALQQLININGEVAAHEQWFLTLRDAILTLIQESQEPEGEVSEGSESGTAIATEQSTGDGKPPGTP